MKNQSSPYINRNQPPSQSEHDRRLVLRLRHLADVVNVKLARADRLARANRLAQADRAKKLSVKEDTHDKTQSPLPQ
jgi:hypothetical protein